MGEVVVQHSKTEQRIIVARIKGNQENEKNLKKNWSAEKNNESRCGTSRRTGKIVFRYYLTQGILNVYQQVVKTYFEFLFSSFQFFTLTSSLLFHFLDSLKRVDLKIDFATFFFHIQKWIWPFIPNVYRKFSWSQQLSNWLHSIKFYKLCIDCQNSKFMAMWYANMFAVPNYIMVMNVKWIVEFMIMLHQLLYNRLWAIF